MPSIALPVSLRGQLLSGSRFNPISLFSAGEQGIWLEPSDLTTMFQDRAGTTPVTTPGQTVGLRLDKSKGLTLGSVSTAASWTNSAAAWDVFSATGGSFTAEKTTAGGTDIAYSDVFPFVLGNWYQVTINVVSTTLSSYSVSLNATTNSRSTSATFSGTGVKTGLVQANVSSGNFSLAVSTTSLGSISVTSVSVREIAGNHAVAPTDAARPTYGIEPKTGQRNLLLATDTMATQSLTVTAVAHTLAFTGTGTVTLTGASIAGPLVGTGASNRVSLTFTPTAASLTLTVVGSVTLAQLELGSTATAYQRVGNAFDVTEAGVPTCHYVQYDGTDDSLSTSSINFTATDKMSVFAGVRKLSDAAAGTIAEMSAAFFANNGSFALFAAGSTAPTGFEFDSRGTANVLAGAASAAPVTNVLAGIGDISGDRATLRINGTLSFQNPTDQGTGNYGNYPLFIGRRNNTNLPFNGRDYGIIIVGKAASATEITNTESYLAANTSGVSI